eukprot:TRINITY_DN8279_c0_g1_i2.p1 TRINITY_DN8279_c0_g1~~TRINITY_DN8279_c0_g1_i2.p1  ORF type:complete len:716 (+),score=117.27 TRINITY_DN8279_c0_g1_i2:292-2439(+)
MFLLLFFRLDPKYFKSFPKNNKKATQKMTEPADGSKSPELRSDQTEPVSEGSPIPGQQSNPLVPGDDEQHEVLPERPPRSSSKINAGLGIDLAAAAMKSVSEVNANKTTVQAHILGKASDTMRTIRQIDIDDEWDEAFRRLRGGAKKDFDEFTSDTRQLFQQTTEDVLSHINTRLDNMKDDLIVNHSDTVTSAYSITRTCNDLLSRDLRKVQIFCILFWLIFLIGWELVMATVRRPRDCKDIETGPTVLQCYNVDDLLLNMDCSKYFCAVPWSNDAGDSLCSSCNCNGICNHCTECLCTVGFGPSLHHICMDFEYWPGSWSVTIRWVVVSVGLTLLFLFLLKYFLAWYVDHRSAIILTEKDRRRNIESQVQKRKSQIERDHLLGTHVEFFNPPSGLYHNDLVKAAVAQRLRGRTTVRTNEAAHELFGEAAGAGVDIAAQKLSELREDAMKKTPTDPEVEALYSSRVAKRSLLREKMKKARASRAIGSTFSSLRGNLGDPWLKDVGRENPPHTGALFDLYQRASNSAAGATPTEIVAAMFSDQKVHMSLPFLRRFLLRDPARNNTPLSWEEFYSDISLAKDYITHLAKGGVSFGSYLVRTSDGLWESSGSRRQGSQAEALLHIAQELAPAFTQGENLTTTTAGVLPHAIAITRGTPLPSKADAQKQKQAIVSALRAIKRLFRGHDHSDSDSSYYEESEEDEESDDFDDDRLIRASE